MEDVFWIFSGSGSLAIEAISRGMSSAVLVEKDRRAQAVIQENIKMTKSEEQFQLLKMDAARALTQLTGQFDLVLLDALCERADCGQYYSVRGAGALV